MGICVEILDGPLPPPAPTPGTEVAGAILCFEGIVRGLEDGRPLRGLHYQTYDPMAENELRRLAERAHDRFGLSSVLAQHSRGFVAIGECSFRLLITSAHRAEALAATGWFIEQMKRDAPIWKSPEFA